MSLSPLGNHTNHEIHSQPQVWEQTLRRLADLDRSTFPNIAGYDLVLFTGCGSTYYLALWAARMCQQHTRVLCQAVPASDLILHPDAWLPPGRKCLLVAVSRSGETTETVRALNRFRSNGSEDIVVVTCYPEKEMGFLTPWVIGVPDANETSVAQTRSFTSMMLGVCWLVMGQVPAQLPGLISRAGNELIDQYSSYAAEIGAATQLKKFFFLGSGPLYGLANEAMLKMKEMSMSHSEAYHVLEYRHGPMSIVDSTSLVIGLLERKSLVLETAVLNEMQQRGAWTLRLCDTGITGGSNHSEKTILLPELPSGWNYPLYLPILQLIAYERALANGLDPDHPTNLTSVVVLDE